MTQPLSPSPIQEEQYPLPIFLFLTGLVLVVVVRPLLTEPRLQDILTTGSILVLAGLHLVLHWNSPRVADREGAWMQYVLAQSGLGISLTIATDNPSVWAVVFTWLIGEVIGVLEKPRLSALSLSLYGLLAVAALFSVTESTKAIEWLGAILPTTLFVGVVVVLYKRQVEARQHAQRLVKELETANQQISAYAERVEELTLANERQRMARELHDTLSQDVAGLVLQLEAVKAYLDVGRSERARDIVQQATSRARSTLRDARAAIDNLRERDAHVRLVERLETLCRRFETDSGVPCILSAEAGILDARLSTAQKEHLERIVSEALANIRKHAQATQVKVHLQTATEMLTLWVEDNGIGFEPERVPRNGHYGLRGLQERAHLLGATLHFESVPGGGTTVLLEMPL